MIVFHGPNGAIQSLVFDPIPSDYKSFLNSENITNWVEVESADSATQYVGNGVLLSRPIFDAPDTIEIIANGVDSHKIENLPNPCLISVDGEEQTITTGEIEIVSDVAAEYTLKLLQWPYIEKTIQVIAHAPNA